MKIRPDKLIELRERSGHTQSSLSKASGVGQSYISQLELRSRKNVTPPTAKALADAMGCDIYDIAFSDAEPVEAAAE